MWKEKPMPGGDPAYCSLRRALASGVPAPYPQARKGGFITVKGVLRMLQLVLGDGPSLGYPVKTLPPETIFLDAGHFGLSTPLFLKWLENRPDISPVFMLHDAIPLQHAELVARDTVLAHERLMDASARYARCLLVPTPSAGAAIEATLVARGARKIPIHPVMLPIDDIFREAVPAADPVLDSHPYFVVCGAIEPRKNHLLLAEVWHRLVAQMGEAAPRLVIAGAPGYNSDKIMHHFACDSRLNRHVFFVAGLSSALLARLMGHARALLMPSLAEGFGLPPLEALTLGTPAILSDIPAHRDAAGAAGYFLPASDADSWTSTIVRMSQDGADYDDAKRRLAGLKTLNWTEFVTNIQAVLETVN
ncbi:glycosyltransferase family 4 protein [Rhizobium sp. RAF56]|uniref:glycosyltransferase family 4 protein n=1 Tax=Rhizobium sp. RAF56 TaxID=3233062 RepID=UPI003F9751B9